MPLTRFAPAGVLFALAALAPASASAQSFDCAKASAADEVAVCRSKTLSRLDSEMADAYSAARRCAMMGMQGVLLDDQRTFLDERAACGADEGCLTPLYRARIKTLKAAEKEIGQGAC